MLAFLLQLNQQLSLVSVRFNCQKSQNRSQPEVVYLLGIILMDVVEKSIQANAQDL